MASSVEIANRALTKLGEERILTLTDDIKAARVIYSMFDIVRDAELRRNNWNFAVKRVALAASTTAPVWGFSYAYPLPSDFLKLRDIDGAWSAPGLSDYISHDNSMFRIESGSIVTDIAAPLYIRYTARVTDPTLFDSAFVEAFACRLAMEACESLTQSNSKRQTATQEYIAAVNSAVLSNAVENPAMAMPDDEWIMARL